MVIQDVQPFKMVLSFKNLFEKYIYTRHYLKMRKILTGAKLLLMSIYDCQYRVTRVFMQ